ncbi:hypothetical protein [Saccharopolyspora oryzae]|uniref:Small secreted protein n=1 Tax=Saccharopolyspora oryzae TaxID=2997343 RepID=A0ABT4UT07_9PSEU|nr:hypothetical protein [Saccharopolyspora oryzae]MDA3624833.1 hypothetical protein [Saccharopolyspora oryzae]
MKLRSTPIAVLAAVPFALAGCAGGPAAPAPPPEPSAQAVNWTGKVCGLVSGFSESQQHMPGLDRTNTTSVKKSVIARIDAAEKSADDTVRGLTDLGAPPVKGAEQIGTGFQEGFSEVRDVLRGARGKAEQIDTGDKQRFEQGMADLQKELDKGSHLDLKQKLVQLEQNAELNAAAHRAPECQPFFTKPKDQQPPR